MGRPLVWEATAFDILVASHLPITAGYAGAAVASAAILKRCKYQNLIGLHL